MTNLLKKLFGHNKEVLFTAKEVHKIIDDTVEACAVICDYNAEQANNDYKSIKELASNPNDMGVLKFVCYASQSNRDAADIRRLKNRGKRK